MSRPNWLNSRSVVQVGVPVLAMLAVAGIAVWGGMRLYEQDKKEKAHRACKGLYQATEAYLYTTSSVETKELTELSDLLQTPGGGQSLLRNGAADLIDPWGKPYQMERLTRQNGNPYILVKTTAPDGTPITQFGIGEEAAQPF